MEIKTLDRVVEDEIIYIRDTHHPNHNPKKISQNSKLHNIKSNQERERGTNYTTSSGRGKTKMNSEKSIGAENEMRDGERIG